MTRCSPRSPFDVIDTKIPAVAYGEYDLRAGGAHPAPFKAAMMTIAPGGSTPEDAHAVLECWMVARGTGALSYDGQTIAVRAGDVLFFEPHAAHRVENTGTEPLAIFSLWWPARHDREQHQSEERTPC